MLSTADADIFAMEEADQSGLAGFKNRQLKGMLFGTRTSPSKWKQSRGGAGRQEAAELFEISACEIFHKHL